MEHTDDFDEVDDFYEHWLTTKKSLTFLFLSV
jgi:hypothetical protein